MPEFAYKARDASGTAVKGTLTAGTEAECLDRIDELGLTPSRVAPVAAQATSALKIRGSVGAADLMIFTRQLSAVYDAGIALVEGLRLVEANIENPALRQVIGRVWREVEGGESLSDALAKYPRVFGPVYVSAIQAGQASGGLHEVLRDLEQFIEENLSLRREIVKALRYPAMVLATIVLALVVLFAFVLPSLSSLFDQLGDHLPLPTKVLLGIRGVLLGQGWLAASGTVLLVTAVTFWAKSERGRIGWDRLRFAIPLIGKMFRYQLLARFATTLAMLSSAGGAIVKNLEITAHAVASPSLGRDVMGMQQEILSGSSLSEAMAARPFFPTMMVHLVRVGETSGRLDEFLEFLAKHYREECRYQSRNLIQFIEPMLTLVAGGVILFLAFAIFLPYWNMIEAFRGGNG